jgi:speckle-type POZ protein
VPCSRIYFNGRCSVYLDFTLICCHFLIRYTIFTLYPGEHEHTIVGYSLIKGLGDGEPIASERFTVGGHEWVLLFYPDGKRSSSELHNINPQQVPAPHAHLHGPGHHAAAGGGGGGGAAALPAPLAAAIPRNNGQMPPPPPQGGRAAQGGPVAAAAALAAAAAANNDNHNNDDAGNPGVPPPPARNQPLNLIPVGGGGGGGGGHPNNDYCALFVALIGESDSPQGVVNTSEGRVVRAFHRFTLVDQSGRGQDVAKGRRRDQGAVKISCARQDPNARNCHGYRKFVKKSLLEDPTRGLLVNDTIIIKYQIELVVSTGGALSRHSNPVKQQPQISVPPPSLGADLASLLDTGVGADVTFEVDDEKMPAHKIILQARSPVFKALLTGPMREGHEGVVAVHDVRAPVFRALLHFAYSDTLPTELQGSRLEVAMAQHLLAAADRFQLIRLRCICEQRLCETVEVETVATTLALAEQNNAKELKRVCLEFVSKHLQAVMASEGYQYMTTTCPQLQSELLAVIATTPPAGHHHRSSRAQHIGQPHPRGAGDESSTDGQLRRVRQRTRE